MNELQHHATAALAVLNRVQIALELSLIHI